MENKSTTTQVSRDKIEQNIKELLYFLGEDPDREGLKETPKRFLKMMEELTAGIKLTNKEIAKMYNKTFEENIGNSDLIVIKDMPNFSFCEHHIALIYNLKISVAYMPKNKIIGLSKIARIVDIVCKRLQVQERIGADISEIIKLITESDDIAIKITANHSCMTARGVRSEGATTTTHLTGLFKSRGINDIFA